MLCEITSHFTQNIHNFEIEVLKELINDEMMSVPYLAKLIYYSFITSKLLSVFYCAFVLTISLQHNGVRLWTFCRHAFVGIYMQNVMQIVIYY